MKFWGKLNLRSMKATSLKKLFTKVPRMGMKMRTRINKKRGRRKKDLLIYFKILSIFSY